jgi:hypothetical protein
VLGAPPADGKSWKVCSSVSSVVVVAAAAPYVSTSLAMNQLVIMVSVAAGNCTANNVAPAVTVARVNDIYWGATGQA